MATGTVTIDHVYFETLLRRAQFHSGGVDYSTPIHLPTVTILKQDHDSLLDSARQYGMGITNSNLHICGVIFTIWS
jgi:hypothetical protein